MPRRFGDWTISVYDVDPMTVEAGDSKVRICKCLFHLRRFQEELLPNLKGGPRVVELVAPTGAGKTMTLLLTWAAEGSPTGALAVYPSRELSFDQYRGLSKLLRECGCRVVRNGGCLSAYEVEVEYGGRVVAGTLALLVLNSECVGRLADALQSPRSSALAALASHLANYDASIVFTVPEYPYLILTLAYGQYPHLQALQALATGALPAPPTGREEARRLLELLHSTPINVAFIDEYHVYRGGEAYTAAALAAALLHDLSFGGTSSSGVLVLSSATPPSEGDSMLTLLRGLVAPLEPEWVRVEARPGDDVVLRGFKLHVARLLGARGFQGLAEAQRRSAAELPEYAARLAEELGSRKVMAIFERVAAAYTAAEAFHSLGLTPVYCATSLRGAVSLPYCTAGSPEEARSVVGNEAISYGVNILDVDGGIVFAYEHGRLIQRLGRIGRGAGGREAWKVLVATEECVLAAEGAKLAPQQLWEKLKLCTVSPPRPLASLAEEVGRARAVVALSLYLALVLLNVMDKVARGAVSADLLPRVASAALGMLREAQSKLEVRSTLRLLASQLTPQAMWELMAFRGATLRIRTCSGGEASLPVVLRNFKVRVDAEAACMEPLEPHYGDPASISAPTEVIEQILVAAGGAGPVALRSILASTPSCKKIIIHDAAGNQHVATTQQLASMMVGSGVAYAVPTTVLAKYLERKPRVAVDPNIARAAAAALDGLLVNYAGEPALLLLSV